MSVLFFSCSEIGTVSESPKQTTLEKGTQSRSANAAINNLVDKYVENQKETLYLIESFITNDGVRASLKNGETVAEISPIEIEFLSLDITDNETQLGRSMLDMSTEEINDFITAYMEDQKRDLVKKLNENPEFMTYFLEDSYIQEETLNQIKQKNQTIPTTRASGSNASSKISYEDFCEIFYSVNLGAGVADRNHNGSETSPYLPPIDEIYPGTPYPPEGFPIPPKTPDNPVPPQNPPLPPTPPTPPSPLTPPNPAKINMDTGNWYILSADQLSAKDKAALPEGTTIKNNLIQGIKDADTKVGDILVTIPNRTGNKFHNAAVNWVVPILFPVTGGIMKIFNPFNRNYMVGHCGIVDFDYKSVATEDDILRGRTIEAWKNDEYKVINREVRNWSNAGLMYVMGIKDWKIKWRWRGFRSGFYKESKHINPERLAIKAREYIGVKYAGGGYLLISKWAAPRRFQCASLVWYCAKKEYGIRLAPWYSPTVTPGNIFSSSHTYIKKTIYN